MKNTLIKMVWLGAVACAAIGCSDNESLGGEDDALRCQGRLGIDGVASAAVVSRAADGTDLAALCGLQVPDRSELRLILTGKDIEELKATETGELVPVSTFNYSEQWATLAQYNEEMPALFPGDYHALLEYGDPNAAGPKKPYYRGEATAKVEVSHVTQCKVEVKIANAAVRIAATDAFKSYFSDAQFQLYLNDGKEPLKDDEGNAYGFTLADTDEPIFVPAGAQVAVKGSVRRPSQTTAGDADGDVLPIEVPARPMAAGTLHTFRFTAQAGGAQIEVGFEDFGAGSEDDVELNDDSKLDDAAPDAGGSDAGGAAE